MRWCVLACVLVGCAGRPEIDPAPYQRACTLAPDSCPAPYQCTHAEQLALPPPGLECFVPCTSENDCGDGFACNGYDGYGVADLGPPRGYCFNIDDADL